MPGLGLCAAEQTILLFHPARGRLSVRPVICPVVEGHARDIYGATMSLKLLRFVITLALVSSGVLIGRTPQAAAATLLDTTPPSCLSCGATLNLGPNGTWEYIAVEFSSSTAAT